MFVLRRFWQISAPGLLALAAGCSSSAGSSAESTDGGPGQLGADASGAGGGTAADGAVVESSGAPSPDYASGSRLHARVYVAGAARLFKTWHDTQLDTDCSFELADDGMLRCVPTVPQAYLFTDAACTKPVLSLSPCDDHLPKFASLHPGESCSAKGAAIYQLGAKQSAAPAALFQKQGTACMAAMPVDGDVYYEGVSKLEPKSLVDGHTAPEVRSAKLSVLVVHGSDGSIETHAVLNAPGSYQCDLFTPLADIPPHCVPANVAYEEVFFSESTCKTPAAFKPGDGPWCRENPAAILVAVPTAAKCFSADEPSFKEAGAKINGSVYRAGGPACTQLPPEEADSYWSIGALIAPSAFETFASKDEGSDRIQVRAIAAATGERLRGAVFFDTQRKTTCRPATARDGQERCLPFTNGANQSYAFADDACTQPLLEAGSGCAHPDIAVASVLTPDDKCSGVMPGLFSVGQLVTPAAIYQLSGATCQMVSSPTANTDYYATTGEILPATFAAVTTEVQ